MFFSKITILWVFVSLVQDAWKPIGAFSNPSNPGSEQKSIGGLIRQNCSEEWWLCEDALSCIAANDTCSGVPECHDESDEAVELCGCLEGEFKCQDRCIPELLRCDRVRNCGHGEDEMECEIWHCPRSHFKCHNGFCVPSEAVCDFTNDCGDNSDEEHCQHRQCYFKEFRCLNGECIRPGFICNGVPDCVDGSDELECSSEDFAVCASGKLVHRFFWCDDWPECGDNHADEINCGDCSSSEFLCPNGRCILLGNVCDAQCDCTDGTDEVNCEGIYTKSSGIANCSLGAGLPCIVNPKDRTHDRCISAEFICDGINHCHNGRQLNDETGCGGENCDDSETTKGFFCKRDKRCLPSDIKCDFKVDCLDGEDEIDCGYLPCLESEWRCRSGECVLEASRCDLQFDCYDRSDEMLCDEYHCDTSLARCSTGQCLPRWQWCDYHTDCPDGSDEAKCDGIAQPCDDLGYRCADGRQCVPVAERCVIFRERYHGCADDSHLIQCHDVDCPPNTFACQSGPCLNTSLRCDGILDCPDSWDDEDFCQFQCSAAVPQCRCLHLEADCSHLRISVIPQDIEPQINRYLFAGNNLSSSLDGTSFVGRSHLIYLDLSSNGIRQMAKGMFEPLWRLRILLLSDNEISHLSNGAFIGLHNLRTLDLTRNSLSWIGPLAFSGLSALSTLDLSHQRLRHLAPRAFVGLRNLTTLTLAHNFLTDLQDLTFVGLQNLQQLRLEDNPLERAAPQIFSTLPNLNQLWTEERRWCCLAKPKVDCVPPPDQFSSCQDLMSNPLLRVCIWILSTVALVGNGVVIVWRSLFPSGNKIHSFLIINLAVGDLLMGTYLLVIAAVDVHFRGVYAAEESWWRRSPLCQALGFCSTLSSELSVFTLTVITVDRLVVIRCPFASQRSTEARTWTRVVMGCVWAAALSLSALPLLPIQYFAHFYGRSGVCLALHITDERPSGWHYALFVFLGVNLASFTVIAVSYASMYTMARKTRKAAPHRHHLHYREAKDSCSSSSIGRRMTLIVITDAACWLPIIGLGVASVAGVTIAPKIYAWVAVFVLPLNAAINPILYTLSTAPFRSKIQLFRSSFSTSTRTQNYYQPPGLSDSCTNLKFSLKTNRKQVPDHGTSIAETRLVTPKTSLTSFSPKIPLGGNANQKRHSGDFGPTTPKGMEDIASCEEFVPLVKLTCDGKRRTKVITVLGEPQKQTHVPDKRYD